MKTQPRTSENFNQRLISWLKIYRLPILSGLLIGTSYIPFYPWALFFCLTPLLLFWTDLAANLETDHADSARKTHSKRHAFLAGWLTQFVLNLIGFHWIAYTAIEFGHFPAIGGALSLLGFAAIAHLYYPCAGLIGCYLVEKLGLGQKSSLCTYTLVFALCDRFFSKIFPWHFGYPWLWADWPGAQFADVIGFEGLNVFTIAINALLVWAIWEMRLVRALGRQVENASVAARSKRRPWMVIAIAAGLVLFVNMLGFGRAEKWSRTDAEFKALAVQGNIGNFEKYMVELHSEFGTPIVNKYLELSRQAVLSHPDAQIMIWPETAFPTMLDPQFLSSNPNSLQGQVLNFIRTNKMPLLTGAYSRRAGTRDVFNGFFYLNSNGQPIQKPYHKSILLVFGETFPFSEYIPYMDKLFPDQGSFAQGSGPTLMRANLDGANPGPTVWIGPQICYEGLYPWFSAELAHRGAQVFTNVTNDSWFWSPFEPNQHLYMTFARAIEFRRPLLRATNTGITTAILANGQILGKSPIDSEWTGLFKIPYLMHPEHTFYERYGRFWPWFLIASLLLTLVIGKKMGLRSEREHHAQTSK